MSHDFVAVNKIRAQLEAAKSGVLPGSRRELTVSGIQNVPSDIIQRSFNGGASTNAYTTFPLSPLSSCCSLDSSYMNFEFDVNLTFKAVTKTANKKYMIPLYIGFRDTSNLFNQIQFLIENTAIWTTTYHRQESVVAYNSLPETLIRGNPQYASIEKMINGDPMPMRRIVLTGTSDGSKNLSVDQTIHFSLTVDINRLTPLLSNLHFTTAHFGNLRLKVFMNEIEKALVFCPDYRFVSCADSSPAGTSEAQIKTYVMSMVDQPCKHQYWQFYPFSELVDGFAEKRIPVYAYSMNSDGTTAGTGALETLDSLQVVQHSKGQPFMSFKEGAAEMVQTCFDLYPEEYDKLTQLFTEMRTIVIPTETWSTLNFNNSTISAGGAYPYTQIGTIGGYNVDFVGVWSHIEKSQVIFTNEFLTDIQLYIDGNTVNSLPYRFMNAKAVQSSIQAVTDTDCEEVNKDYTLSLTEFNLDNDQTYIGTDQPLSKIYGNTSKGLGIGKGTLRNPNSSVIYFSTNLPEAFCSGACTLKTASKQASIRFNANSRVASSTQLANTSEFPLIYTHMNSSVNTGFSALCDCCIVLNFEPERQKCFDGQLTWASPFADE